MDLNPANMSSQDLEEDMASRNKEVDKDKTLSSENPNTSEEPEVKPLKQVSMDMGIDFSEEKEQDLDELAHQQSDVNHNGNTPDPEELKFREGQ